MNILYGLNVCQEKDTEREKEHREHWSFTYIYIVEVFDRHQRPIIYRQIPTSDTS